MQQNRANDGGNAAQNIERVISAIVGSDADQAALHEACSELWKTSTDAQNRDMIVAKGGVKALLHVIRAGNDDKNDVQEMACATICNSAVQSDANLDAIVQHGGVDALLRVFQAHKDSVKVQETACAALVNIVMSS
jgi:hypothetical protein